MDISLPPAGIQSPVLSGSTTTQKKHGVLILHRLYWIPQETPIFRKWIISCATQSRSVTSTDPWMSYFDWIFCNCLDLHRSSKIFKILWWSEPQHRAAIVIIVPSFRVLERPQDRSLWWGKLVMCAAVSEGAVMGAFEVLVKRSRMLMKRQVLLSGVVLMYQGGIKVRNGREACATVANRVPQRVVRSKNNACPQPCRSGRNQIWGWVLLLWRRKPGRFVCLHRLLKGLK